MEAIAYECTKLESAGFAVDVGGYYQTAIFDTQLTSHGHTASEDEGTIP
jgi:hypothetical protein